MTTKLHTPYRALSHARHTSAHSPLSLPSWASKRSVYRVAHATYYVAETTAIDQARADLAILEKLGWDVTIEPLDLIGAARITMRLSETSTRVA